MLAPLGGATSRIEGGGMRRMGSGISVRRCIVTAALVAGCAALMGLPSAAGARDRAGHSGGVAPNAVGMLDCNGLSTHQTRVYAPAVGCTDPRSIEDGKITRFEDNGHYVGHDEPIVRFLSNRPGSANDVTWTETLPRDPAALPTVSRPGHDVTHWFELSGAPWFSMS